MSAISTFGDYEFKIRNNFSSWNRVSFFLFVFLNNIVCDSVPLKVKRSRGRGKHTWKQRCPKTFYFNIGIPSSISLSLSGNFRESSDISSITAGIPELGLHFYTAKEFPSSPQFFFCRRVKTVPSLEEMYPRQREASLGKEQWKQDQEGGHKSGSSEVWGNKMSKEISHVVWLVTLVNIKTMQKLLCSLNVYKKLGQKRGKERFCSLSQNLKSYRIIF